MEVIGLKPLYYPYSKLGRNPVVPPDIMLKLLGEIEFLNLFNDETGRVLHLRLDEAIEKYEKKLRHNASEHVEVQGNHSSQNSLRYLPENIRAIIPSP